MTPLYEKILELVGILDSKVGFLLVTIDREGKDKAQLSSKISDTKKYISNITDAISVLSGATSSTLSR